MARRKPWDWRAGLVGTSRRRDEPFPTLTDIEGVHIDRVLQAYGYNFVHAARALGISRATLYRRMNREAGAQSKTAATQQKTNNASRKRVKLRLKAG